MRYSVAMDEETRENNIICDHETPDGDARIRRTGSMAWEELPVRVG